MPGPSNEAKAIEAWIEKHRAVMTPDELHTAGYAKNAADQLINQRKLRPQERERYEKMLADWTQIGGAIEARLRED